MGKKGERETETRASAATLQITEVLGQDCGQGGVDDVHCRAKLGVRAPAPFQNGPQVIILWSGCGPGRRTMAVEKDVVHSDDVNVDPGSARRSEKGLLARDELVRNESKRPDVFGKRGELVVA